ncbi:MAG: YlxR family protein [Clostridiaceae bacterium]|nr:YlxR family protein [Clostridiaceae bacterium]
MQKQKKIPMRQCLGCREHKAKKELLRVVRSPEGEISLDARGKKAGRGAYLCPAEECLKKARRSRALERALECAIPDAVYDALESQMSAARKDLQSEKPEITG